MFIADLMRLQPCHKVFNFQLQVKSLEITPLCTTANKINSIATLKLALLTLRRKF